jgi:hypothetical protein
LNLPVYTQPNIFGSLLDWVGQGIYGYPRPAMSIGFTTLWGPYDTTEFNQQYFNQYTIFPAPLALVNDDIYKRCLTWHLYKGDGKYFCIQWLKRRITRFLFGENGTDPTTLTCTPYQIGISIASKTVTITLHPPISSIMTVFLQLLQAGALELPFQFSFTVVIG